MAEMNEGKIIEYLQKIMDSRFTKFILEKLSEPKKIQKALAIYAGVEKPSGIKEKIHAGIVAKAIEKAAGMFDAKPEDIKDFLKDPYMRK